MPRLQKIVLSVFLLMLIPLLPWTTRARTPAVLVVVAKGTDLTDVSVAELRKLFLRNTTGIDGHKMVPLNQPAKTEMRMQFDQLALGMSEAEVGRYWVDRRVRGESGPPTTLPSSQLVLRVVAKLPDSIGYMREDEVDASVRVLKVNGKSPSDPDYPLK
jgi:hypothetical protein